MSDPTQVIPGLDRHELTPAERPDPLDRWIQIDRLAVFATAGTWALLTHHDWLRTADTVLAVTALTSWLLAAARTRRLL